MWSSQTLQIKHWLCVDEKNRLQFPFSPDVISLQLWFICFCLLYPLPSSLHPPCSCPSSLLLTSRNHTFIWSSSSSSLFASFLMSTKSSSSFPPFAFAFSLAPLPSFLILCPIYLILFSPPPGPSSEPRRLASLGSLLDDQHWHHLAVERRSSHLNLTVDKHTERVQIPAEFSHWEIEQVRNNTQKKRSVWTNYRVYSTVCHLVCVPAPMQLSIGDVQDFGSQKPKRSFHGCLENLLYNSLNLIELAKNNDHQVTAVVSTFHSGHDGE